MDYIDFIVEEEWLRCPCTNWKWSPISESNSESSTELMDDSYQNITWKTFTLLTGKHVDLSKRIGKKIRVFRDGGNVYVSDHDWILGEIYKSHGIRARCSYTNPQGEALLEQLSGLNIGLGNTPLEWTIE